MRIGIAYDAKDVYATEGANQEDIPKMQSILSIKTELENLDYDVTLLGDSQKIMNLIANDNLDCDIVYNTVQEISSQNRQCMLPALLETYNIPYIGTDSFGISLAKNKYLTKVIAQQHGIKTPKCVLIPFSSTPEKIGDKLDELELPITIKLNYEGNRFQDILCYNRADAIRQVSDLMIRHHADILCEEYSFGLEITIPYMDTKPKDLWDITTADVRKNSDLGRETKSIIYNNLSVHAETKSIFEKNVKTLYEIIGCRDFCQFDFRMSLDNEVYFIEANPLPSLGRGSSFEVVGKKYGYTYPETLQLVVETACKRLELPIVGFIL